MGNYCDDYTLASANATLTQATVTN